VPAKPLLQQPIASAVLLGAGVFGATPILGLIGIALGGDTEVWAHLAAYVLPSALTNTGLLLAGVAALTALIGVGTAWLVTAFQFPGRDALIWLLALPLAIPTYLSAYIYVDVFDGLGAASRVLGIQFNVRSLGGAILVMSVVLYPYVYLAARAAFQMQGPAAVEAARTMGASQWHALRDVTLPLARPAIAAGLALALLEALNDIGACEYLGVQTLTLSVFTTWLNRNSLAGAAQIACVMMIAVAALIAIERFGRRKRHYATGDHQLRAARILLHGRKSALAALACALPVIFGFALPFSYLVHEVIARGLLAGFDIAIVQHTAMTVMLTVIAAVLTIAFGFGVAIAARLQPGSITAVCILAAGLGYAIPGAVLALGVLSPLVAIDEGINFVTQAIAGRSVGLVLAGSSAALIIAYVLRFAAITIGFGQSGLGRISPDLDDAARVAGASAGTVVRTIQLPLLRPALWGAALLVFVDCLKELPATLLLRPLNIETLATYIFQFATRGSFEQGALAALLIVAVGILPVIRMVRFADTAIHDGLDTDTRPTVA